MSPHHTCTSVMSSLTIKRSIGDLPVNSPVLMASALEAVSLPSPFSNIIFCKTDGAN